MNPALQTPMMRQYLEIKSQNPDTILFFRMGDFYEMFLEDAVIASKILDITLTSRNKGGGGDEIPFCGVPYHSAQPYIARLIEAGHRVAVCEQVEDPKQAKGIVRRDVVKVVTPALVTESESLTPDENSYLLAICAEKDDWGTAWLDLSTGEFKASQLADIDDTAALVASLSPRELLLPEEFVTELPQQLKTALPRSPLAKIPDWVLDYDYAAQLLTELFKVASPDAFGLADNKAALKAVGAILYYLQENRHSSLPHLQDITLVNQQNHLLLDPITRRNLELVSTLSENKKSGSLLGCLDRTATAMGARTLKQWLAHPLINTMEINQRLDAIELLVLDSELRNQLITLLKKVQDLERLNGRIALASANSRDLRALFDSLELVPQIKLLLAEADTDLIRKLAASLDALPDLQEKVKAAIVPSPPFSLREGNIIAQGYNTELDELRTISREGKGFIARMEAQERERTGINSLKIRYNRVFGYYIEITKANLAGVPENYTRRQTLANAERFITEELKIYEEKVLGAEDRICELEYNLFQELRMEAAANSAVISNTAASLAQLDILQSLATVAAEQDYCRPTVNNDDQIEIVEGRHPVVEALHQAERFVPNDTCLDAEKRQILMITGPNMAGKSTYMRQTALIVLMAQVGSFVPAKSAVIGIADRIFTRVGAGDNLAKGQSTFMVEMMETANILRNATPKSLVILDEIGRGTSTFDGLSIAWAVAEYLHDQENHRARTLFATHYHELAELAVSKERIVNLTVAVREWQDQIVFLRTIVPGAASHSYGIQVARLAGIPMEVISRAKEVLKNLEDSDLNQQNSKPGKIKQADGSRKAQQFSLFDAQNDMIKERLEKLDITALTPLTALNILDELKKML
ncbi:MAG: DNA mismatch repair protein MutS [Trichlorobacter sp.]|jgi:DNA mismatch repair protein MutS|nr:DNA mismatch repair protein MutS [Trichlorobacter sp.]